MRFRLPLTLFTSQALLVSTAFAGTLFQDISANYNATILGDLNVDSADTEGRQLVVGNFNTNIGFNYTIGSSVVGPQNVPSAGRDDMVVGGNYVRSGFGGVLVTEDAVIGGTASPVDHKITFNSAGANSSGSGTLTTGVGPISIDRTTGNVTSAPSGVLITTLASSLVTESQALGGHADSAGISAMLSGTFALDITTNVAIDDVYIINVTAAEWTASSFLTRNITASADSTVIINVSGSSISLGGSMNLLGGITQNQLLVNYHEAEDWSSTTFLHEGSILAASTNGVSISGGAINGASIFGGDVTKTGSAEFHNFLFTGDFPASVAIPEPNSSILLSLSGLGLVLRRRKTI